MLAVYVVQVLLLGAAGSLLGLGLGALMLLVRADERFAALGAISVGLTLSACLQAFGIGLLVSLLFALVPLLEVRRVRPLLLLREETSAPGPRPPPRRARRDVRRRRLRRAIRALTFGLDPLQWPPADRSSPCSCCSRAGRRRRGAWALIVSVGFVLTAIALHLVGPRWCGWCGRSAACSGFRCGTRSIGFGRPGHQTRVILLAVGLGVLLHPGRAAAQMNLKREFSFDLRPDAPDMFLIDVQQDQRTACARCSPR